MTFRKSFRRKGMRVGSGHSWKYSTERWHEKKVAPRKWSFVFIQQKTRAGRNAPRGSGMPLGSRLHWGIRADQYAVKTGSNTYRLVMKGTKIQKRYAVGKRERLHR